MGIVNDYNVQIAVGQVAGAPDVTFQISKKKSTLQIHLCRYPTQNCQLSSIGMIGTLLDDCRSNLENVQPIIRECCKLVSIVPHLMLVDVRQQYVECVEKALKVFHKHPYISTNGSYMCLFMVDISQPFKTNTQIEPPQPAHPCS